MYVLLESFVSEAIYTTIAQLMCAVYNKSLFIITLVNKPVTSKCDLFYVKS